MKRSWHLAVVSGLALSFAACNDDSDDDGGATPPFISIPTPFAVELSPAGPDQLLSVAPGPDGSFYAAGYAAAGLADPRYVTVAKITSAGALDLTFGGGDGIAMTPVVFAGGTDEIDIAVQPATGKILVSATVANDIDPADRDVAILRLDANGDLDVATFAGGTGVRVLDLNSAIDTDAGVGVTLAGLDGARNLAVHPLDNTIFLLAYQRGEGFIPGTSDPRTDTDFTVARLTVDGDLDLGYGGGTGKHLLDFNQSAATPRSLSVFQDGSVIAGGYANSGLVGWTTTVQPVLYKLTPAGALDPAFGTGGLFHQTILSLQTEVYNVAVHGTTIVTGGYGRDAGTRNDWISLRFSVADGSRDTTWGGAVDGVVVFNPSLNPNPAIGSNCRGTFALPGGKTLMLGSTGQNNNANQDAVIAVLDASGKLDPAYGGQPALFTLGLNGNDQFWGGAVSGGRALVVGFQGGAGTVPASDDDSYAVLVPLN
jgi:uncharacterized delta-60 repeat protein